MRCLAFSIRLLVSVVALPGWAQTDAVDVDFDDSGTTQISGANVQEALESADGVLADVDGALAVVDGELIAIDAELDAVDAALTVLDSYHDPALEPDASVVLLRQDCTGLKNCVTTMEELADANTGWIWTVRNPTAANPLLVDIGPGSFGIFNCPDGEAAGGSQNGHVSLRGAGRDVTTIGGGQSAVLVRNCTKLSFSNLRVENDEIAVLWLGVGDSTWSNVDLVSLPGGYYSVGWYDYLCPVGEKSLHYFFRSRIITQGSAAIPILTSAVWSECAEIWWYGGEILMEHTEGPALGRGVWLKSAQSDFRMFGSALRVVARPGVTDIVSLTGVIVESRQGQRSQFHMHGGIINVSALEPTASPGPVLGMSVARRGTGHTPGTAWILKNETGGSITRLVTTGTGKALSPFLWESGTTPPRSDDETNVLGSLDGQDLFVETDCDDTGDCNDAGNEPHMMIYADDRCGATDPWFDVVTGLCRNEAP